VSVISTSFMPICLTFAIVPGASLANWLRRLYNSNPASWAIQGHEQIPKSTAVNMIFGKDLVIGEFTMKLNNSNAKAMRTHCGKIRDDLVLIYLWTRIGVLATN
jgi:hypothetical protein